MIPDARIGKECIFQRHPSEHPWWSMMLCGLESVESWRLEINRLVSDTIVVIFEQTLLPHE